MKQEVVLVRKEGECLRKKHACACISRTNIKQSFNYPIQVQDKPSTKMVHISFDLN